MWISNSNFQKAKILKETQNFCLDFYVFCTSAGLKMSDSEEGYSENEEASIKAFISVKNVLFR